jgi:hypothetical protein
MPLGPEGEAACAISGQRRAKVQFPSGFVNWLTYVRANPGDAAAHRKAEANFNFRGWQGR